jgi:plastocyanin
MVRSDFVLLHSLFMKRILTTLFVLSSVSVSGIAAASNYYGDSYNSGYTCSNGRCYQDNYYYNDRYSDDYYYSDRYQDDWYYDSRYDDRYNDDYYYNDSRYDSRYTDDYYYNDRYRTSSYVYGRTSKIRPISRNKTIEIRAGDFRPESITVTAGTTVTWVNRDRQPQTVRSEQRGLFASAKFYEGQRYSVTFLYPGTFDYFSSMHPGMRGTVRVVR